jgi:hypothetical protein
MELHGGQDAHGELSRDPSAFFTLQLSRDSQQLSAEDGCAQCCVPTDATRTAVNG